MNAQPKPDIEPTIGDIPEADRTASAATLKPAPFDDGNISGLFFPGAGRQEALDQITHLLRYGPSLLLLHGDQGVGKHFLIDHVIAGLDMDLFDVAMVQSDVLMSPEQLLSGLAGPWHSREVFTLETLQQQLIDCATVADNESRVLLLLVRQSQYLDEASVQMISLILASCAGLPVKVLLVMDVIDPDALDQFAPLFDQVPDHFRLELVPFTQQETHEYVAYRMRTGGMGHVRFNEEQSQRIFNMSLGNAARINEVAGALLRAAINQKQARGVSPTIPWMHVGALGAVVLILLVLVFNQSETELAADVTSEAKEVTSEAQEVANVSAAPELGGEPVRESSKPEPTPVKVAAAPEPEQDQSGADVKPLLAEKNASSESAAQKVEPQQTDVETTAKPALATSTKTSAPKPEAPLAVTKPKPAPEPKIDSRSAWILAQPADYYAIQLLGAREKATVDKFLAAYPSVQKLTYYEAKRNGAPWYVVVQASFPSYDAAKSAVAKLPQKLQKQGPWIRKIEAIQKDLKN